MFEQTFLSAPAKTRRAWTVAVSFALQMAGIGVLVLIPLLSWERLKVVERAWLPAPPSAAPKAPEHVTIVASRREPRRAQPNRGLVEPAWMPRVARQIVDPPAEPTAASGDQGLGVVGGLPAEAAPGVDRVLRTLVSQQPAIAPAPAPPTAAAAKPVTRQIRISQLDPARLVHQVTPLYPPPARIARVSGTVVLSAIVGTDGRIRELKLVSGHPMLAPAAMNAVQQWRYRPTTLSGEPVEVITVIEVHFSWKL